MSLVAASRRAFLALVASLLLALSLIGTLATPVHAATISVTAGAGEPDDGACSLREAIQAANTNLAVDGCPAGEAAAVAIDVINVPAGTYEVDAGELVVTESVDIVGAGATTTIIDANGDNRVFNLDAGDVEISNVTITEGSADDENGGGLYVQSDATLNLVNSVVTDNHATDAGGGGGIFIGEGAGAILSGSTVSGNSSGSDGGGGIHVDDSATLELKSATIIDGNSSDEDGGGIVSYTGVVEIVNSTISGNMAQAGGGMWTGGEVSVLNSTIRGNSARQGGGIYIGTSYPGQPTPELPIENSTISGNTASFGGGGIYNPDGAVSLLNSTVSGNTVENPTGSGFGGGGGLLSLEFVRADFSTIANNTAPEDDGGGLLNFGDLELFATIVANNPGGDCEDAEGSFTSEGSNLDSDGTCELDQPTDKPSTDPDLGTLASNGGPTQTHALLLGSPAIDAVVALPGLTCVATDQRGVARPQDGDSNGVALCDIGAYELALPAASIDDVSVTEGNSGTVDAVFTVTLSAASSGTVTMAYATANGTATTPADYQAAAGTVTFTPGDTSETITVKVVGDTLDEPNETFFVNLTAPVGATLADAQGTGTILDDDGAPAPVTPTPSQQVLADTTVAASRSSDAWIGFAMAVVLLTSVCFSALGLKRRAVTGQR